jgi:hypothetical protein
MRKVDYFGINYNRMKKILFGCICLLVLVSCSSKKADLDPSVQEFFKVFQDKLSQSDEEVLKVFSSDQAKDVVMKVVQILRNQDSLVVLNVLYDEAKPYQEDYFILVDVPIDLKASGKKDDRTLVTFKLLKKEGSFLIIGVEGDRLYSAFLSLRDEIKNASTIAEFVAKRKPYYERASQLQKNYDTVIWYVNHDTSTYYYVVNGNYNLKQLKGNTLDDYKMGLVDKQGKIIVPLDFDLVFNPSSGLANAVEVMKKNKIGFYSLDGKEIIPVAYDWLIPYNEGSCVGLVMKDSVNGWLDKEYVLHEGFPSKKAERAVNEFEYLTGNKFLYSNDENQIINVLSPIDEVSAGTGIVIAPTYLVKMGLLPQITDDFLTFNSNQLYQYGHVMIEAKVNKPSSLTEILDGFVADIQSRFIGGRGEFYNDQKIVLVNKKRNLVASFDIGSANNLQFKKLSDSLFQYTYIYNGEGPGDDLPEIDIPQYNYFYFNGNKLTTIESSRRFPFTQFMKIDSSYLKGVFQKWNPKLNASETSTFLSKEAIAQMRDEILASYGFVFVDRESKQWLSYAQWYKPTIDSYDEVYAKASEIDKYNLDFLAKLIGPYNSKPA